ncbi:MAG TPA: UbiA-like polyprenyltransferase [Gemmatimonadaceae bacterium]|nr:UbiA-like polyprenyltransferase [Gemmatimonadaceae bacterium]
MTDRRDTAAATAGAADFQTLAGSSQLVRYANFVKLPHTLFALPFALLGVVAASLHSPVRVQTVALAVVAFTAARWVAMGFNRIADRHFDALSPRNRNRELPRNVLTVAQAWASVLIAAVIFLAAAWALNPLCAILGPVALAWIMAYSYTKRFTHWPHLWLGISLAIAPVGGYLAVTGAWSRPWWVLAAITVAVSSWVAGFDIFYALPDEGFDRAQGLRSAVVRFGVAQSIGLARLLHALTIPALVLFGVGAGFGAWYFIGVAVAAGLLVYEHSLVRPNDLSRLDAAFFTMNAVLSATVFSFALLDRLV